MTARGGVFGVFLGVLGWFFSVNVFFWYFLKWFGLGWLVSLL